MPEGTDSTTAAGGSSVFLSAGASSLLRPFDLDEARRYVLADYHARFRRMRGDEVLFSFGLDSIEPPEATEAGAGDPAERRGQIDALGLSSDWSRSFETADAASTRWAQQTFKGLLDAGSIERTEVASRWCESCRTVLPDGGGGERCRRCEGPTRQLPAGCWLLKLDLNAKTAGAPPEGPFESAIAAAPPDLLGRVDGVEIEVKTMVGSVLTLFTPFPDKIGEAKFIALAPSHPALEGLILDPDLLRRVNDLRAGRSGDPGLDYPTAMDTGVWVPVPDIPDPLPVIASLSVDARFGVAAILGIPAADPADAKLAERLPAAPSLRWDARAKGSKPRPAVRFRAHLLPISSINGRGVPVPPESPEGALDPRLAWTEALTAIPPEEREGAGLDHAGLRQWLPSMKVLQSRGSSAAILCDLALLDSLPGDASQPASSNGSGHPGGVIVGGFDGDPAAETPADPSALAEEFGADALRFALLHAAAPPKGFRSSEFAAVLRASAGFLERLRAYAQPRLGAAGESIDTSDRNRRRLAKWCDTARRRITENNAALDGHRATRNAEILLARIEDFEQRAREATGELSPEDSAAIGTALRLLISLLTPVAPAACEGLLAGVDAAGAEASWPTTDYAAAGSG